MSKAQTDIRTTSYDELAARPDGYIGTIEDALAQIRAEPDIGKYSSSYTRWELEYYLGVRRSPSAGPSVELDQDIRYGTPDTVTLPEGERLAGVEVWGAAHEPGFYTLDYAMKHWPHNFSLDARVKVLSVKQLRVYIVARNTLGVRESLALAEKTVN
jgi:hypothetical protein